jgi:hypothetical protein
MPRSIGGLKKLEADEDTRSFLGFSKNRKAEQEQGRENGTKHVCPLNYLRLSRHGIDCSSLWHFNSASAIDACATDHHLRPKLASRVSSRERRPLPEVTFPQ